MKTPSLHRPLFFAALLTGAFSFADPPAALDVLSQYDAIMSPATFQAVVSMTAHRDDGTTRTYKMNMLKGGDDRSRIWFQEPAASKGQEILRNGDNAWIYMPNLKRSLRMASRESFQGGDFNNADVLRTNYAKDYTATIQEDAAAPDTWLLELKAKTNDASYDAIKLWVKRAPLGMPVKGEYYTQSGKMLRSAQFVEMKDFGNGLQRPARVKMRNELATQRWSELFFESIDVKAQIPSNRFALTDLGR